MSPGAATVLLGAAVAACAATATEPMKTGPEAAEAVKTAAAGWLAIVDEGRYEDSWHAASEAFRLDMARFGKRVEFWVKALETARSPLEAVRSRRISSWGETTGAPGAPEGSYVEIVYESRFEGFEGAVGETVVMALEPDGVWRTFSYVIRR